MLHYTVICYAMLCYTMLCYAMLYYAILCYAILYYTILYYTILYYTISVTHFRTGMTQACVRQYSCSNRHAKYHKSKHASIELSTQIINIIWCPNGRTNHRIDVGMGPGGGPLAWDAKPDAHPGRDSYTPPGCDTKLVFFEGSFCPSVIPCGIPQRGRVGPHPLGGIRVPYRGGMTGPGPGPTVQLVTPLR